MARKRKLTALDMLDGHPSHARPFEALGIEGLGEPFVPEHLLDDARGCVECIKLSMPPKIYSSLDSYLLAAFGMAWAIHKQASSAMAAPDFMVVSKRGQISRWLVVLDKATNQMSNLAGRLGLDPLSRQNLKLPQYRADQSKFAGLIGRRQLSPISSASGFQAGKDKGNHSSSASGSVSSYGIFTNPTTPTPD